MNVIADRLFALLLGWTKSLFNSLWNLLGNRDSGALGFIQRFWLPLILILLAVGVMTDYVIWLIRWRPYFVWRTWLRNIGNRRRERMTQSYMESLDRSPLDLPGYTQQGHWDDHLTDGNEPVYFDFEETRDGYAQDPAQDSAGGGLYAADAPYAPYDPYDPYAPQAEEGAPYDPYAPDVRGMGEDNPYVAPLEEDDGLARQPEPMGPDDAWDPLTAEPSWMSLFHQARQRQEEEAASGAPRVEWAPPLAADAEDTGAREAAGARRRRSERTRRKPGRLQTLRDALFYGRGDEPVDSLPPPVRQDSAFREPYIPQNYRYSSGPGPQNGNGAEQE